MRRAAILLALAALGASAGCGGGDDDGSGSQADSGTTTPSASTREEFIAFGDAICEDVNGKVDAFEDRIQRIEDTATSQEQALADAAPLLADGYDLQRDGVAKFRDLTPPAGDEETVDKIVAALEQQTALVGQAADAADSGNAERLSALGTEADATRTRVRGLLQGYGFRKCGSGTSD